MLGALITIEGCEGVGKSTIAKFVCEYLTERGKKVVATREPGGTPVGEAIRNILVSNDLDAATELHLVRAARECHIHQVILPAVRRGEIVVCDRYIDSTFAYQSAVERPVIMPMLTILLDARTSVSMQRIRERSNNNCFDMRSEIFHKEVRQRFLMRHTREPDRIKLVDAELPLHEVKKRVVEVVEGFFVQL